VADVSTTPTGAKYRSLPDTILIFICTFDPFNGNIPRYTFRYTCDEEPKLKLKDGSLRIFLNTTATKLSALDQNLQAFYHYLQMGVVESDLAQTISASITTLKNNSLERRHYMTWTVKMADARYDGYDEGFEKGITTGREEGISIGLEQGLERGAYQTKLETAKSFLAMGLSPEQVTLGTNLPLETVLELAQTK
jgi:predicted transposase/invertase (TIGR01784 family)